ncbi:MAG: lipopolysaccharide biosynthesis protein, partial [Muribaculaceae bacterium]|nr:lipopolysaccharide biosynthesis protein [Muribaculaceae bacterium]
MAEETKRLDSHSENTKRIAKNTGLLYVRTIVMMLISLYTSRIVLEALGVDNYGINNVVGGVVGMFSIISGSLSGSISRFLTFALGEGNVEKLRKVFSLSVSIQILIGVTIIIIGEIAGIWFINHKLNISPCRIDAAHWVFQCGLLSFFMGLISVPYNACLIAHERMGVFAYMTIVDASIKLLIAYAIFITQFDKLITLA